MASLDERIIAAIESAERNDFGLGDRLRPDDSADNDANVEDDNESTTSSNIERLLLEDSLGQNEEERARQLDDALLRRALGNGPQTGPKSVLADRRFHNSQENAREQIRTHEILSSLNSAALSSGWLQRQIAQEEIERYGKSDSNYTLSSNKIGNNERKDDLEDEDVEFLRNYKLKRLEELKGLVAAPTFGHVHEITSQDELLSEIEDEDPATLVIVYMFHPTIVECAQIDNAYSQLAANEKNIKFLKVNSNMADPDFDLIALPAFLVYRCGETISALIRIQDEIPNFEKSGRISVNQLYEFLVKNNIIQINDSVSDTINQLRLKSVVENIM